LRETVDCFLNAPLRDVPVETALFECITSGVDETTSAEALSSTAFFGFCELLASKVFPADNFMSSGVCPRTAALLD